MKLKQYNIDLCTDCYIKYAGEGKDLNGLLVTSKQEEPFFKSGKYGNPCSGCDTKLGGDFMACIAMKYV